MSKNGWISGMFAVVLALQAVVPAAFAQTEAVQAETPPPLAQDAPLTVSNVVIDKTDKNAVLARAAAMADAKREAFRILASRRLPPDRFRDFKLPEDGALSAVVQDFEITREQLSTTRYVATFTVRFRASALALLGAAEEEGVPAGGPAPVSMAPSIASAPPDPRSVLVLPYLETADGKILLWEDGNAWMEAWQAEPPAPAGWSVAVPAGDIADVAAGPSDAVWAGETSALEKLRAAYGTAGVVLAVMNKAGSSMVIDLYSYRNGVLERLPSVVPVAAAENDTAAFRQGISDVMRALQNHAYAEAEAPETGPVAEEPAAEETPPSATPAAEGTAIEGEMTFENFAQWMELQKRVGAIAPPATLKIRSLSNASASFVLRFGGDAETLKGLMAAQGVVMSEPALVIGEPGAPGGKPVYTFQLAE